MDSLRSITRVVLALTAITLVSSAPASAGRFFIGGNNVPYHARGSVTIEMGMPPEEIESDCANAVVAGELVSISDETFGSLTGTMDFARIEGCQNGLVVTFQLPLGWNLRFFSVSRDERGNVLSVLTYVPEIAVLIRGPFNGVETQCRYEGESSNVSLGFAAGTVSLALIGEPTVALGTTQLEQCPEYIDIFGRLRIEEVLLAMD